MIEFNEWETIYLLLHRLDVYKLYHMEKTCITRKCVTQVGKYQ